jgi:hypothetical protein
MKIKGQGHLLLLSDWRFALMTKATVERDASEQYVADGPLIDAMIGFLWGM